MVVKHTNPCGVAVGEVVPVALTRHLMEPDQCIRGIVAINGLVEAAAARGCRLFPSVWSLLVSVCVGNPGGEVQPPACSNAAAIDAAGQTMCAASWGFGAGSGYQPSALIPGQWRPNGLHRPRSGRTLPSLEFGASCALNAIVVARDGQSLGIGAGQMNRVGSARLALEAAAEKAKGAVLASDGFFPFDDTVRLAASHGISAVIHPGGSLRDADSIKACDELGLAMLLTGRRHFLH